MSDGADASKAPLEMSAATAMTVPAAAIWTTCHGLVSFRDNLAVLIVKFIVLLLFPIRGPAALLTGVWIQDEKGKSLASGNFSASKSALFAR
jgi:hypothetical protein